MLVGVGWFSWCWLVGWRWLVEYFYEIFVNMKPNMTGPGRPGRDDQDSLVGIAVRSIGWDFVNLVDSIIFGVCVIEVLRM